MNRALPTFFTAINQSTAKASAAFFVFLLVLLVSSNVFGQTTGDFRSRATGNWNAFGTWERYNGSAWVNAVTPEFPNAATNNVLIRNGHTVTVNAASAAINLTVGEGTSGQLNLGAFNFSISGTTSISSGGTISVTSTTGLKSFTGNFTNNGTWTNSINSAITFLGDVTNNGTFTAGTTATYSFSGSGRQINTTNGRPLSIANITWLGSYTVSANFTASNPFTVSTLANLSNAASSMINNGHVVATGFTMVNASTTATNNGTMSIGTLTITSGSATFQNNGTVDITTAASGSGTFANNANATLNYGGAAAFAPGINASANPNLVNYNRANTQTIKGTTYHNLTVSGSNTKTLGAATTINRDLIVTGTATLADGGFQITGNASGTMNVGAGTGFTTTRTAAPWFPLNTPIANITLNTTSTVTIGGAATNLNNTIPTSYGNLTISGSSTKNMPGGGFDITVRGNLTLTTALADNGAVITVNGNISGAGVHNGAGKILLSGGSAPHQISGSNWGNVELDDVQGAVLSAVFSVGTQTTGSFTLTNGVVTLGNFNFSIANVNAAGFSGSGFSASKMFLQNGTGEFRRNIANSGLPITYQFPIGESTGPDYSPVSINILTNSTISYMSFTITDTKHPNDVNASDFLTRFWTAVEAPANFTYTGTFGYIGADENGNSSLYDVFTYAASNGTWKNIPATASGNSISYDGTDISFSTPIDFVVKAPIVVASTVTVGSGGNYATLTGAGGLFDVLNQGVLTGNLVANIISTPITEPGTIPLFQIREEGAGAGTYTVTIQSDNATQKVLTGNYDIATVGNTGIFRINGADRVTFNGGTGTDRRLLFRNTNAGSNAMVFHFLNDATNCQINNCTIEGAYSGVTGGLILIGSSTAAGTGNDNNTITYCDIKQVGTYTGGSTYNVGIYGSGFSTTVSNDNINISYNNIYNFNQLGTSNAAGIRVESGNTNWNVTNNNLFQTSTITSTLGTTHNIIYLNTGSSNGGHTVSNNNLGLFGTGAVTYQITTATSGAHIVTGIRANVGTANVTTLSNNVIRGFDIRTSTGASPFTGIAFENGRGDIEYNMIGDTTGNDNIIATTSTPGAISRGINNTNSNGTTTVNIRYNNIGSITTNGTLGTVSHGFNGINNSSNATTVNLAYNKIGSSATLANIRNLSANSVTAAGTTQVMIGINSTGSAGGIVNIENNQISNLYNAASTSTSSTITRGILVAGNPLYSISNNTIYNLTNEAVNAGTGANAAVIGILHSGGGTSQTISNNTIYGLRITNNNSTVNMYGIVWNASNSLTNTISKNFIHSFNADNTSNASEQGGIFMVGNLSAVVSNNMIRLGIQTDGSSVARSNVLVGISDNSTVACNYYYNTVLIAGTCTGSQTANTYAFRRGAASGSKDIRNNIFANYRTGGLSGSTHYSFATNATTGYTAANFDNNLYYSADGSLFSTNNGTTALAAPKFQALRAAVTGANANSGVATATSDINFIDATGNAASVNLKLNNTSAAADAGVVIATITDDREGDTRSGTMPDIGADEGPTDPIDIFAPKISNVTSVANITTACGTDATINISATVVDAGSGVAGSPLQPQLWWRLSTGTYAAIAPSSVSVNTYNYVLNLTGITAGQTYQYYIAAQDSAGNISYSHFNATSPVHASVTTAPSTVNGAPASFNVLSTVPLSGTVTVGSGGDYATFNGTSGLFAAINTRGLSGNLQVNVISNIAELPNWTPLNQWQEFCGTGYTVTISPNAATVYTVEANSSAANAMFSFYGVQRLTIDGRFNGSGRFLRLRHNRTTTIFASTIEYNNGAKNNVLRSCIIEGQNKNVGSNTTGSVGVVRIGGSMGFASGTLNNITIEDNEIRNLSNLTQSSTNTPYILLYVGGASSGATISDITIRGNNFYNFFQSAISIDNGNSTTTNSIGDNFRIENNNIYQSFSIGSYQYAINFDALGLTTGHLISGNKIGGNTAPNPNISGTWTNGLSDGEVWGMYFNIGDAPSQAAATIIRDNTISNITLSGTGWSNFLGIRVENGRVNLIGNTIGSLSSSLSSPNITMAGNGGAGLTDNSMMAGIWSQSTEEVVIDSNIICGLATTSGYSFMDGIAHGGNLYFNGLLYNTPAGKATITNNQVLFCRSSSVLQNLALPSPEAFMGIFCWTNAQNNLISNNKIRNCGSGTAIWNANVRIHGMFVGVYGSTTAQTGIVSNNEISHLFNENPGDNASSTSRNPIIYGMSIANGNWTVSNNTIYLNNGTQGGTLFTERNTSIRGLNDGMLFNQANCQARYYNNTVYVSGANLTGLGQPNSTYAFLRFPLDYGSILITAGAPIELKNNIFINDRGGSGNHRAVGNIANTNGNAATNWNSSASDFNFLATTSTTTNVALWGASTTYTLANFQSLSGGGDANTTHVITTTGSSSATQMNPSQLFINVGTGAANLRINITPPNAPWPYDFLDAKGTPVSVTTDIDNESRNATTPDIGADEFEICTAIVISPQPINDTTCENTNASFTVTATGTGLSYQWQVDTDGAGPNPFSAISNGGVYSNATTNTLNITGATAAMNGYLYRVRIASTCTTAVYSSSAVLTINVAPSITAQPSNVSIPSGSNTTFSVSATGSGTITYVWQLSTNGGSTWSNVPNSAPYSNVTSSTMNITAATIGMNSYQYRVIVSGLCSPPDTSNSATLTVTSSCTLNTWTGATNTLWEEVGNWSCSVVPDTSINVVIPNVTNDPVININITGGVKNIIIEASGNLTMVDNAVLNVTGDFENNGSFSFSGTSNVVLLGSRAQSLKTSWVSGNTNSFNLLTLNKSVTNTVTALDNINILTKTMIEKGELVIPQDVVARSKRVELKDKLLIRDIGTGTKAGELRVNE